MSDTSRLEKFARDGVKLVRHGAIRIMGSARGNHVVFVAGVQRSGTEMIMEVLERSPDTKVFVESDRRAFDQFQLRPDGVIQRLARSMAPCVVFKALCDNHRIASLIQGFVPSSSIWVYRHFDNVVASQLVSFPNGRNQIDALVKDRSATGWRGRGMTDETWEAVKERYRPDLNSASAQALFWFYRNQLFFDQRLDEDTRVRLVRYEDITCDPRHRLKKLGNFLGIRVTAAMVDFVSSGPMTRKPLGEIDTSIRGLCAAMLARLDDAYTRQETTN